MNSVVRSLKINDGVAPAIFRDAMRNLAGGVSVVTVGRGRDVTGMTVTSVSSLAVDPPTLIVCVNLKSSSWDLMQKYSAFGVNILQADQVDVALKFSGAGGVKGADRFAAAEWTSGVSGTPLLVGALAAIDCRIDDIVVRHSHAIVIGQVQELKVNDKKAALAYWQGKYLAIDQDQDSAKIADVGLPSPRALWQV